MPSAPFLPVISCNNIEVCSEMYGRPRAFWLHVWMAMKPFISALSFPNTTKEGFPPPLFENMNHLHSEKSSPKSRSKFKTCFLQPGSSAAWNRSCVCNRMQRWMYLQNVRQNSIYNYGAPAKRNPEQSQKTVRQVCTSNHGKISMMS